MKAQGLTAEQHARLGDYVVWDEPAGALRAPTRDDVGARGTGEGIRPALGGTWKVKLVDGKAVEVATLWTLYGTHLKDYDLDTVVEITQAPRDLIRQLAQDLGTMKPAAIHPGEGINHWFHGDLALIVNTPKFGRRNFTGETHMPTPTKAIIFSNVNLINNAKWAYGVIKNVNPNVEMIVAIDIQMTASIEYADLALPANSWLEFEGLEIPASCSNPFLQIWKGGIPPVFDSRDDLMILAGIAKALAEVTGDRRFADYFKFALEGRREIYLQRLLDTSTTTQGYKLQDIMAGKYGPPGGALMSFRARPPA